MDQEGDAVFAPLIAMWNQTQISNLESNLWDAADELRANSKLTSSEYFFPVMGVIFLRHAQNRFEMAARQIEEDQAAGRMPKRKPVRADYIKRRALFLPETARYDTLLGLKTDVDLGEALNEAMEAIEADFEPLRGQLPKDYRLFERDVLEQLLKNFNHQALREATGDVFGRIYEYFLMKFSMQKAHDNGEFFTPPSLVQVLVNVLEPERGIVFDPACGSGGMFVQTSHFVETHGHDTAHAVTFYGQEKTPSTIPLAKMNLAVHALEGDIREANTFYQDEHTLVGKCDFVMANPPFNVDKVEAKRIEDDRRLPFGLPGVNKQGRVSNGNYLWISYFHSYLNDTGRAGFVMSSQASSAGNAEKEVRRRLVETGDVDVMVAIRSNFFYTRTVPSELWHFDKGKPAERRDQVLMIDARNLYRKVTRKIYDFTPEQQRNLAAIVWLYRGEGERFLALVRDYFQETAAASEAVPDSLSEFQAAADGLLEALRPFAGTHPDLQERFAEAEAARSSCAVFAEGFAKDRAGWMKPYAKGFPAENKAQHQARRALEPLSNACRDARAEMEATAKALFRLIDQAEREADARADDAWNTRDIGRKRRELETRREEAGEVLRRVRHLFRQIPWLQDRFPEAVFAPVEGLCRVVTRAVIGENDWSLTPGRYVGVAPVEEDEDFDFEESFRALHAELADLDREAAELSAAIADSARELLG